MSEASLSELPGLLLPYQLDMLRGTSEHEVTVVEKSRRIGGTWGFAADAVLLSASAKSNGGDDTMYMGYEKDMTREFIDACAMWAREFSYACSEVEEFIFRDEEGDKDIQAFRIVFASGFQITALCSRPRALRGKQGFLILDEAAFHDDLAEVLKAAMAFLIWGGKLLIISTHNGVENPFNQLVQDCKSGRVPYHLITVTFADAVEQGLYRRICLTKGWTWSPEAEAQWVAKIRAFYRDNASEELDCIPRASGGKYLSRVLLESRAREVPVVSWKLDHAFVDAPDEVRTKAALDWCEEHLRPVLAGLGGDKHFIGEDFGRSGDLSILWITALSSNLSRECRAVVEMRNIPFREQETVLKFCGDNLPRFSGAALDARGNGQYLAERARQMYGAHRVHEVMLSTKFYSEQWPRFRAALEDDLATIPAHSAIVDDFRTVEVVKGVPVIASHDSTSEGQRHGDSAIAALLAFFASWETDLGEIEISATKGAIAEQAFPEYRTIQESEFYQ